MTDGEKSAQILSMTDDGNGLSPSHLYLVQLACNRDLNEMGRKAFEELYQKVVAGQYVKPWFYGIEHLTADHQGWIYWRGVCVEHFTIPDAETGKKMATELAARMLKQEADGQVIRGIAFR